MPVLAVIAAFALGYAQLDPNIVKWRTYKAGAVSNAQSQQIRVLQSLGDYQRYVNELGPQGAGDGRDIDWAKEELVAIHIGSRQRGGYSVEVTSITKTKPTQATVFWSEITPMRGSSSSQSVTSPWTIVRLDRPGVNLTFSGGTREDRLPGGIQIINLPGYDECRCCAECIRAHRNQLPYRIYASGDDAPLVAGSTDVMNSAQDYISYCRNYNMPGLADRCDVDWNRERLLAIHLGRKMTPGYMILIDHVDIVDATRVDVSYTQVEPSGQSYVPGGARGPYLLIRIPRVCSHVTFTKHTIKDIALAQRDTCTCGCKECRCRD